MSIVSYVLYDIYVIYSMYYMIYIYVIIYYVLIFPGRLRISWQIGCPLRNT